MNLGTTRRNWPLGVQGAYFFLTGVWSLVHYPSFEAITGPKTDVWLVRTVGVLVIAIGTVLFLSAALRRERADTFTLAYGSGIGLMAIDIVYAVSGRIARIYLLDAAAEAVLMLLSERHRRRMVR